MVVGITLAELLATNKLSGILFALSLSFVYLTTSALFEDLHTEKRKHISGKRIVSAATFLLGVVLSKTGLIPLVFLYPALGFVSGVLIYIIGKEVLPQYKASNPLYFAAGVMVYSIFILLLHGQGLI